MYFFTFQTPTGMIKCNNYIAQFPRKEYSEFKKMIYVKMPTQCLPCSSCSMFLNIIFKGTRWSSYQ